jgi:putative membrane protein
MWHGMLYYGGGGLGMLILGVLFWGSIIALVVWAVRRMTGRGPHDTDHLGRKSPMDHLKERYAKGEITKEQYEEIKRDLLG